MQVRVAYESLESALDAALVAEEHGSLVEAVPASMAVAVAAVVGLMVETALLGAGLVAAKQDA